MKLLATLTVLVGSLGSAGATIITYNTVGSAFTGTFNGAAASGTTISASSGSSTATLTYNPIMAGSSFDDATPGSNLSYGTFVFSYSGPDVNILFPTFTFNLKVTETAPLPGGFTNISASSNANGVVSQNSSFVNVTYVPTTFNLPGSVAPFTAFTVISPTQLVPSTSNGGSASIQGFAVGTAATGTPEPTTILLMGVGLLGIGSISHKKFAPRG